MPDSPPDAPTPDPSTPAPSDLVQEMQAGNAALASDAQALQDAATTADQIAAEAHSATANPVVAKPPGAVPAPDDAINSATAEPDLLPQSAPLPNFSPEVRNLLAIEVPVIVQLGVRRMSVGEVMRFSVGAIIEFQKAADEELELLANNKGIGQGHAVKVGENFGIKITKVGSVKEMIRKLGAA